MNKYFSILFLVLIFQSCLDLRSCDFNKLHGRYYCYNNEKTLNWLDLKKDGTFSHYYKQGSIELSHHGTWKKDRGVLLN